ncbi:probable protein phosphatase 2C T23F11.1 [Euwallacea fornicatus]|uniref:probable protein phosphatase 2C T23F11.1 n=1 Tax=Euwallacea fornicatus TaxID=995702 RepID=UPI00338DEFC6
MGQTLSEPVTAKDTTVVRNSVYRVGSSCMQGWRINMEDSHTHILSVPDEPTTAFFGVYDGHGGAKISDYAGKHLHKYVVNMEGYKEGDIPEAIKRAFLKLDEIMYEEESLKTEQSGSTAIVVVIKDNTLFCANIGDSRAIAGVSGKLEKLSYDHKPNNPEEYERITDAGGWVDCNRVNGNLALSRAFGDYIFKRDKNRLPEEQIVIALPDVIQKTVTPEWDFVVLACDGIWDVMTDDDVLNFVIENIASGLEPEEICENLMMRCLAPDCQMAGLGCDNMTVVIVVFLHGKSYDSVVERCKSYLSDIKAKSEHSELHSNTEANTTLGVSEELVPHEVKTMEKSGENDEEEGTKLCARQKYTTNEEKKSVANSE